MHCPHCGYPIHTDWQQYRSYSNTVRSPLSSELPSSIQVASAYRKIPFRKMELASDVLVPLAQACITGMMVAVLVTACLPFFEWPWFSGIYSGLFTTVIMWGFRLALSKNTLWIVEEIIGRDIDGDGQAGRSYRSIRLEIKQGRKTMLADLPGDENTLIRFARHMSQGASFSERAAAESGYGVSNFRKLRDIFVQREWAAWNNPAHPQQGLVLTDDGRQIIQAIAAHSPTVVDAQQNEPSVARTHSHAALN